ncbi:hypothetical protein DPMN_024679 [Dreissena polymorpha]|uniref:Uncharacterized protein n=1 Tax=Dreissena polymorpha TaxID=45954 RepID=A0A9D4LPD4_DREPO|nr:hypothetical protein DPMN_024679 [Dreissena polymorpha]
MEQYRNKRACKAQNIIGTNLQTKFHEDRKINVASRVLRRKNAPPPGSHVFQANIIIFELIQDIIETNLLTKFHKDWTINVASREKCPAPDIIGTNLLTKFHDDRKINVTSRELTSGGHVFQPTGIIFELVQDIIGMNLLTEKNAPTLGGHVFQANVTIFELIQDIIETNVLAKFHEDWTINANVDAARHTTHDGQKRSQKLTESTLC